MKEQLLRYDFAYSSKEGAKKRNTENVSGLNKHDLLLFSKNNISVVLFIMCESSKLKL